MKLRRKDLTVDLHQGETVSGKSFGWVGDLEGDSGGYFFTWGETLEETIGSLDPDEIDPPRFPAEWAECVLRKRIRASFDDTSDA